MADAVYPVDADGEFPFPRLVDYARANGHGDELDALLNELGRWVEGANASADPSLRLRRLADFAN